MARTAAVSKITSKGQVTIPQEIRREAHLRAGEQVEWEITDHGTVELRRAGGSLDALARILPRPGRVATVEEMKAGIVRHLRGKHRAGG